MPESVSHQVWNVPNILSTIRLILAWIVFVLIEWQQFWLAFVLFVIAVGTDWVDGWYARKFGQVTQLGRILDPFCDKIIICGTFIQVAALMYATAWPWYYRIMPWMAVVVVARELLVTALRSAIEAAGGDFSASFAGKLKMLFQCFAVSGCLVALALSASESSPQSPFPIAAVPGWVLIFSTISIWLAIFTTLSSGWDYVWAAAKFLKQSQTSEPQ